MDRLPGLLLGLALSTLIGYAGYRREALTRSGWLGAVLTGTSIFGFGGLDWGLLLIAFFASSSLLTRYKESAKVEVAEAFAKGGPRDLAQALANGGVAAAVAIVFGIAASNPAPAGGTRLLLAAFVGAMAEANADTWATELGVLAKRKPRLITNGRVVAPGASGGVTWLGTLSGLSGAALIGGLAALFRSDWQLLPIGAIAGLAGSLFDSLLGATIQGIYYSDKRGKETEKPIDRDGTPNQHLRGWRWMTNDAVNLLSTLAGAIIAYVIALVVLAACANSTSDPTPTPPPPTLSPATPIPADTFDFPLDPTRFGPYVYNVTGPLNIDTRFGVQNPGLGSADKCFVDRNGDRVPFDKLYHAGEDWFALDARGQVAPGLAADAPVSAVAHGVVSWTQSTGTEGDIVMVEHALRDGTHVWSAYWHLDHVSVVRGQVVRRGDVIGRIFDRGPNSHLHWEIRTWGDGSNLFPADSAGGRGTCNSRAPGLGYTWDDTASRAAPQAWGYLDPVHFVREHR